MNHLKMTLFGRIKQNQPHPEPSLCTVKPLLESRWVGGTEANPDPQPCVRWHQHLPFTQVSEGAHRPSSNKQPGEETQRRRSQSLKTSKAALGQWHLLTPASQRNSADLHGLCGSGLFEMTLHHLEARTSRPWLESVRGNECRPGFSTRRTTTVILSLLATRRGRAPEGAFLVSSGGGARAGPFRQTPPRRAPRQGQAHRAL